MSKTATATAVIPGTSFSNGAFIDFDTQASRPDATEMRRTEIVEYVKSRLGPDLAGVFSDAIKSSVATACYDQSWASGDFSRVDVYVSGLQQHWLRSQGDVTHLLVRLQHLLAFGSDEQKAQLKTLLELP